MSDGTDCGINHAYGWMAQCQAADCQAFSHVGFFSPNSKMSDELFVVFNSICLFSMSYSKAWKYLETKSVRVYGPAIPLAVPSPVGL